MFRNVRIILDVVVGVLLDIVIFIPFFLKGAGCERLSVFGRSALLDKVATGSETRRCPISGSPRLAIRVVIHLQGDKSVR